MQSCFEKNVISLEKFQIQEKQKIILSSLHITILNPYEVRTIYLEQSSYAKGFPRKVPRRVPLGQTVGTTIIPAFSLNS